VSPHHRLDEQIAELSGGRLTYDVRRRQLTCHRSDGGRHALEITETDLRTLLQRLLLEAPQPVQGEPMEVAVGLLLEQLDAPE
jgi:hypothetical protein